MVLIEVLDVLCEVEKGPAHVFAHFVDALERFEHYVEGKVEQGENALGVKLRDPADGFRGPFFDVLI